MALETYEGPAQAAEAEPEQQRSHLGRSLLALAAGVGAGVGATLLIQDLSHPTTSADHIHAMSTADIERMLVNTAHHGVQTNAHGGAEGLYQVYYPDGAHAKPGDDPKVDLQYYDDLVRLQAAHPGNHQIEQAISQFTPVIEHEWANYKGGDGSMYFTLMDIYGQTHNAVFQQYANEAAGNFYFLYHHNVQDGGLPIPASFQGNEQTYNVAGSVESAAALIVAGHDTHNQAWIDAGSQSLNYLLAHDALYVQGNNGYGTVYPVFATTMDAQGHIVAGSGDHTVAGQHLISVDEQARIYTALDAASKVPGQEGLKPFSEQMLAIFDRTANPLGLANTHNGGYFNGFVITDVNRDSAEISEKPETYVLAFDPAQVRTGTIDAGTQGDVLNALVAGYKDSHDAHLADAIQSQLRFLEDRVVGNRVGVAGDLNPDGSPVRSEQNGVSTKDTVLLTNGMESASMAGF